MFGSDGTGGLGFQLSMYQLHHDLDEARRLRDGTNLQHQHEALMERYNHLLAAARALEQAVQQRDARIAELEKRATAAEAEVTHLKHEAYVKMCARLDAAKEEERQRDLRSQGD